MSGSAPYLIPRNTSRTEISVSNSRFITTISRVDVANDVKKSLEAVREAMPDATHHAYAFRIGYGNSVIEGMSDAGEPPGTAGAPILSVLRGTNIGDILIVVTRYFGGAKLGTGGLVRAYTEAARVGLDSLATEKKVLRQRIRLDVSYKLYDATKRLIATYDGLIENEIFTTSVLITAALPQATLTQFQRRLSDVSAGQIRPEILEGD